MFQIIYYSTASVDFTPEMLAALLAQSRVKNARLGITGVLLFRDGRFIQVLEGREKNVRAVFQSIKQDRRHHGIISVVEHPPKREFPEWTMSFVDLSGLNKTELAGYSEFLAEPEAKLPPNTSRVHVLLELFKKSHL